MAFLTLFFLTLRYVVTVLRRIYVYVVYELFIKAVIYMDEKSLIAIIDVMKGITSKERKILMNMNYKELEEYYNNRFQEQNDEQLEIAF